MVFLSIDSSRKDSLLEEVSREEDEFLDEIRDRNWLGSPETSVEAYVVSGESLQVPEAQNYDRLEPYIGDLKLLTCFRDSELSSLMEEGKDNFYRKKRAMGQNLPDITPLQQYLDLYYTNLFDREVSLEFDYSSIEVEGMEKAVEVLDEIESAIEGSGDYSLTGVGFGGFAEHNDARDSLNRLENDISFQVYFLYSGDSEAVEAFKSLRNAEFSGVPGSVHIGSDDRPYVHLFSEEELPVSSREVEQELDERVDYPVGFPEV